MTPTKNSFRTGCLKKMRTLSKHNVIYRNKKLNRKLIQELRGMKKKRILFYYPLGFEIDILNTLFYMRKSCEIYIPFMEGESFKMVPFRLPLKQKKFGIFESGDTFRTIKKIDVAIVPAVGVDINLQRVGFGKGMYDRFFAKLKTKPYTIFIQPEFCYTDRVVCDSYDISADLLLTPKVRKTSKKYNFKRIDRC